MALANERVRDEAALREARRLRLIEATVECIARHGLGATTLVRVGQIAGYSPATVHFHFDSKDALLLATLSHVAETFEERWREALAGTGPEPAERLRALIAALFDPTHFDPRLAAVWDAFWGEARAREDYMRVCGERDRAWYAQIRALVTDLAQREGATHVDADAVAQALAAMFDTLPQQALADAEGFDADAARATCEAFLASVFPRAFPVRAVAAPAALEAVAADAVPVETLPGWTYHNEEFLELEKEHLFRRQWLLVGHVSEVAAPGDYMTLDAADERVLVVRGNDGELHGMHNVCRHRASRVVEGERGNCGSAMVCPYHGWTYHLDGRLRGIPKASSFRGIDIERCRLPRVEVETCHGFVFARITPGEGPGVAERIAPLRDELAAYRLEEMRPLGEPWSEEMAVNWKCVHDNDNEGYHVPIGHPGLNRLYERYDDHALGNGVSRSYAPLREEAAAGWSEHMYTRLLPEIEHLPQHLRRAWLYFGVFPNASFGLYPDMVECFQAFPLGPDRSLIRGRSYALPGAERRMRAVRYLNRRINRSVWREDLGFCVWTNAGLRSSGYDGGPLSDHEPVVRQFHDTVRRLIPVAASRKAPPRGRVSEFNADDR